MSNNLVKIKGLGPVGVDIALGTLQRFYPAAAPFLDKRSRDTASNVGLGDDVNAIFEAVGSDAERMARMEVALTRIRLEKKESMFK